MKIKRYIVKDMQEAVRLIKQDLGNDAVIVSSYKVPARGIMGLFSTPLLEVTAAKDEIPGLTAKPGGVAGLGLKSLPVQVAVGAGSIAERHPGMPAKQVKALPPGRQQQHNKSRSLYLSSGGDSPALGALDPFQRQVKENTSGQAERSAGRHEGNLGRLFDVLVDHEIKIGREKSAYVHGGRRLRIKSFDSSREPEKNNKTVQPKVRPAFDELETRSDTGINDLDYISGKKTGPGLYDDIFVPGGQSAVKPVFDPVLQQEDNIKPAGVPPVEVGESGYVPKEKPASRINPVFIAEPGPEKENISRLRKLLVDLDLQENIVEYLLTELYKDLSDSWDRDKQVINNLKKYVTNLLESAYRPSDMARVLTFVGPTGVGKTTSLAKLATRFSLYDHKKIALIAVHTYRLGAMEHLQSFGNFLDIPVEVVMTPPELVRAMESHADKDYVFIDTAGRSARSASQVLELKGFLDAVKEPQEIFLVLSLTTKNRDLNKIANEFLKIRFSKLIFTKLDETETTGSILNLISTLGVPAAYLADGQGIPDNIFEARPYNIANLLFRGLDPEQGLAI